ncbi:MAG: hypothetical protein M3Y50_01740 [Acidobacteriota bacterium]|nr:hypothetical protein [Acidobacteriota bacterium]
MQYHLCRHIKTNGTRCKAPSLTDTAWCYFHTRLHQRHSPYRYTPQTRGYLIPGQHIELTALEDRESVQVALSVVINALATGSLDPRRATTLLYGLQLASSNAARLNLNPAPCDVVQTMEPCPDGLDLAAPGATRETVDYDLDDFEDDDDDEYEDGEQYEED